MTVDFERLDEIADKPGRWDLIPLRATYTTQVTIEEGRETRIVVP